MAQAYRAALSFTDRNIGVVLDGLDEVGFAETTIVALWADHGYQLGDNAQVTKTRSPFCWSFSLIESNGFRRQTPDRLIAN